MMKKFKNLWYYYKLPVLGSLLLIFILCTVIINFLGIGKTYPDYQIAYVGETRLPDDTINSLCNALESISEDLNHDNKVIVQINQYTNETSEVKYTSNAKLLADIVDCESYFFLLENPDEFQKQYEILDYDSGVYRWANCPVLNKLDLNGYSIQILDEMVTGDSQELLSDLYVAHRYMDNDEYEKWWELLTKDAFK